eukprot:6843108-Prymnesium_polylepis.1
MVMLGGARENADIARRSETVECAGERAQWPVCDPAGREAHGKREWRGGRGDPVPRSTFLYARPRPTPPPRARALAGATR